MFKGIRRTNVERICKSCDNPLPKHKIKGAVQTVQKIQERIYSCYVVIVMLRPLILGIVKDLKRDFICQYGQVLESFGVLEEIGRLRRGWVQLAYISMVGQFLGSIPRRSTKFTLKVNNNMAKKLKGFWLVRCTYPGCKEIAFIEKDRPTMYLEMKTSWVCSKH